MIFHIDNLVNLVVLHENGEIHRILLTKKENDKLELAGKPTVVRNGVANSEDRDIAFSRSMKEPVLL